ncbi:MAG: GNAT family N-acetyltransferase [Oscillochloris sp.]|nr:GNAT family N-acetyltransferase [Oscillochloris sp.]
MNYQHACRVEQALASHIAAYGSMIALLRPESHAAALAICRGWAVRTGSNLPINRAVGLGLSGPMNSAMLDQIEMFYQEEHLTPEIELCPLADRSLHNLLRDRGYQYRRCMSVLSFRHDRPLPPAPNDIEISIVAENQAEVWIHTVATGFTTTVPMPEQAPDIILSRSVMMRSNVSCFLATINDEPAGAGAVALGNGVAILFSASTVPAFRRRGVQSALIQARLAAAETAGCDLIVVQSTPGSESQHNLQRYGFQVAYTNVVLGQS